MNPGSFEQTTTSRLIEKTGGLINWKFTHRAKVSSQESKDVGELSSTDWRSLAAKVHLEKFKMFLWS